MFSFQLVINHWNFQNQSNAVGTFLLVYVGAFNIALNVFLPMKSKNLKGALLNIVTECSDP